MQRKVHRTTCRNQGLISCTVQDLISLKYFPQLVSTKRVVNHSAEIKHKVDHFQTVAEIKNRN